MARMALTLWSTQTPGNALRERDTIVMNNKKKVENKAILIEHMHIHTAF